MMLETRACDIYKLRNELQNMVDGSFSIILEFETISRRQETVLAASMDSLYISLQFVIHNVRVTF